MTILLMIIIASGMLGGALIGALQSEYDPLYTKASNAFFGALVGGVITVFGIGFIGVVFSWYFVVLALALILFFVESVKR